MVPLTTISTCRLPQRGGDQPLAPMEDHRVRAMRLRELAGVRLDLMTAGPAPHD
jgi:hypothetical protein